jgi:SnoaL-like domain
MLTPTDVQAIERLINLYGHILDDREYSRAVELFTVDAFYDVTDFDSGVHRGPQAIAALWAGAGDKHPLAHHATNIVITEELDGTVRVVSKGMGIRRDAVGSVVYRDVVVLTAAGWRIRERIATSRLKAARLPQP